MVATPPTPPSGSKPLTFGLVPDSHDDETRAVLSDFCVQLSEASHIPIRPHVAPSPAALASAFARGRVDVAWVSPTLLLTSRKLESAVPLVQSVRQGVAEYHAALFVAEDSPLKSPADLQGAHAAWVAATSAAGFIFPRLALASHGLVPDALFTTESFHDSHGAVARAVLSGHADVGATYAVFEDGDPTRPLVRAGFVDAMSGKEARVLHVAGPIPSDLIVAAPGLAVTVRAALVTALEHLADEEGAKPAMWKLFGADRWQRFEPGALDPLREQVDTGRALGLLD